MTLWITVVDGVTLASERARPVRLGRAAASDVRIGHVRVDGRWTVSQAHVEAAWDGSRWVSRNVSDKLGLLAVYEPGYEELLLEPGRTWSPVRHRWSYRVGRPEHPFFAVCATDDHDDPYAGGATVLQRSDPSPDDDDDDDQTALFERVAAPVVTTLERKVLVAYYAPFACLPRPAVLEPRSHRQAALLLARSTDSARKAIERVNQKIGRLDGAPPAATGRNVSAEIGRWLARVGVLDP